MKRRRVFMGTGSIFLVTAVVLLAFTAAYGQQSPGSALPKRLTFATLSVGTVFHVTGSGLAKIATENTPMTVAVAPMASARSWVYQQNKRGKPELGIMQMSEIWQAHTGKLAPEPEPIPGDPRKGPPYKPASPKIRILLSGTPLRVGFLVRDDSPIKTMKDIKGKRMAWVFPAFPPLIEIGLAGLSAAGMTIHDVVPVAITEVVAGVRALMERRVEVTLAAIGMPIVGEANARMGVRFLGLPMDAKAIRRHRLIMAGTTIKPAPPGLPGLKKPTPVNHVPIVAQATTHMPDNVAYALVKVWWDHHKELAPIHPQFRGWTPKIYVNRLASAPYHTGAIKFYKEKGAWTKEHDKMQARLLKGELPFLD